MQGDRRVTLLPCLALPAQRASLGDPWRERLSGNPSTDPQAAVVSCARLPGLGDGRANDRGKSLGRPVAAESRVWGSDPPQGRLPSADSGIGAVGGPGTLEASHRLQNNWASGSKGGTSLAVLLGVTGPPPA